MYLLRYLGHNRSFFLEGRTLFAGLNFIGDLFRPRGVRATGYCRGFKYAFNHVDDCDNFCTSRFFYDPFDNTCLCCTG